MSKQNTQDLFKKTPMTFGEHLEDLRLCLFKALLGLAVGFVLGLLIGGRVVDLIQMPLQKALAVYYQDNSIEDIWEHRSELREAGYAVPEDFKQIKKGIDKQKLMFLMQLMI